MTNKKTAMIRGEIKMVKLLYEIEMQTLIGVKYGTLYAEILHDEVKGFLHLLKHSTAFYGNIDKNGQCKIQGKIISLTKTIPYQATGYMKKESIMLDMYTDQEKFHIIGKEVNNEEIL